MRSIGCYSFIPSSLNLYYRLSSPCDVHISDASLLLNGDDGSQLTGDKWSFRSVKWPIETLTRTSELLPAQRLHFVLVEVVWSSHYLSSIDRMSLVLTALQWKVRKPGFNRQIRSFSNAGRALSPRHHRLGASQRGNIKHATLTPTNKFIPQ
jgi:hypothetical protein